MFAVNRDIVTTTVKVYEPNHVSTLPHRPKVLYGRRRRMEWATVSNATERSNGLSKLETIVANFGDNLSPKTATVAKNGDCRRIGRL